MLNKLSGLAFSAKKLQSSANNLVSLGRNNIKVGDNPKLRFDLKSTQASKIDISKELVSQINAQSGFSANAKIIVVADETIGTILDIKS
jgi:flagellar hook protein FlgE